MTVYIGHAVGDEHGNARGGEAGNQANEIRKSKWYLNKKGWRVLRANSAEIGKKIADDMRFAIANKNIGYDQGQRNTLYDTAKQCAFNCALVSKPCETDCSALIRVCVAYAGVNLPNFNTASEPQRLLASGAFSEMLGAKYTDESGYLREGDILVTKTKGHTVVVLNDGDKVEPEPTPEPTYDGFVLVKGNSVRVRKGAGVTSKAVGVVHKDDLLPYIGTSDNGWYNVEYKGTPAYISGKPRYTELIKA